MPVVNQHYRLLSLTFRSGQVTRFADIAAQFVPIKHKNTAPIFLAPDSDLSKTFTQKLHVAEIQYELTSWHDKQIVTERFKHPVVKSCQIYRCAFTSETSLFELVPLNEILATRAFPGVMGAQFIC